MKTEISIFLLFIAALLFASPLASNAQDAQIVTLTNESLASVQKITLDDNWKYQTGDDAAWAQPNIDDSRWKSKVNISLDDWRGIAWARIHLNVADDLAGVPLNLELRHLGASEVYLDGKLIGGFGTVGRTLEEEKSFQPNFVPLPIVFERGGEHVIAVRYSNQNSADINSVIGGIIQNKLGGIGFKANLTRFGDLTNNPTFGVDGYSDSIIEVAVLLSFCLLHLLLYAFYPQQRGNLFYGLFLLSIALQSLMFVLLFYTHYTVYSGVLFSFISYLMRWLKYILLLIFLYVAFEGKVPRRIWWFVIGFAGVFLLSFVASDNFFAVYNSLYLLLSLVTILEAARIVIKAWRRKVDGAWIVAPGVFTRGLIVIKDIVTTNLIAIPVHFVFGLNLVGTYGLILSISIYLARQFAKTNAHLETQLVKEVEHEKNKARLLIVEAENERRAKELEEARQLQLSMLPKRLPQIEGLEIAAYMKPATEVGGDYYDFHVGKDGTLTVAVGDATGHGLKAGSVVTATKSLFNAFAKQDNISQILKEMSQALKQMNLRGLFMAMTMLKIKDNQVNLSIAGMPSALIYHREDNRVEELAIRAMPLGSFAKTNYQEQQITLAEEDVVVLMSDGFPEMFNPENEMLGFGKAAEILSQIAQHSAQEIINHLIKIGEEWANGRAQDDDVTFVVLKIGGNLN